MRTTYIYMNIFSNTFGRTPPARNFIEITELLYWKETSESLIIGKVFGWYTRMKHNYVR